MAASATFALKAGVWFRRGRLLIVSPDSLGTACPLSGRNSTHRPVQISGTSSRLTGLWDRKPNDAPSREGVAPDASTIGWRATALRRVTAQGAHSHLAT